MLRQLFRSHQLLVAALIISTAISGCASVPADKSSAAPAAKISVVPSIIDFKSVVVGQKNSQTLKITNSSAESIDLEQLRVSGSGFTLSSAKVPVILPAGAQVSVTVVFAPASTSNASGSLVISSSDLKAPVSVPLSGSGEKATPALTASPASLNFGTRAVKSSTSQSVTLKNTGNIALSISSVSLASSAFSTSGLAKGVSLSPDQKVEFQVWFHPTVAGNSSSTITVATSSLPTPVQLSVAGSATNSTVTSPSSVPSHSVTLDWDPSTSTVAGYHIYRSESSSGPFQRVSNSVVGSLNYRDTSVQPGGHYYYVVTAVEADGSESVYSNEVAAEIPST
jgi:Transmembrane protein 131-like N-terminal/Abnormal spindle-like microcephaly-assoc'd, ASPM-SPD-2-Hydin